MLAHKYGYRVGEVPAPEPARLGGNRKLRVLSWGGAIYLQFLLEFFRPRNPKMLPNRIFPHLQSIRVRREYAGTTLTLAHARLYAN